MPLFAKDPNAILQESLDYLKANTSLNSIGPGSRIRAILEILKQQVGQAYAVFDFNTAISFVYGAKGEYLDYLGDIFGLKRYKAQTAITSSSSQTIKFYTLYSSFGLINNNQDILIPAGTEVWATRSGIKVPFYLVESITLDRDKSEGFATVKAKTPGSFSNVATNSILYHDFTEYSDFKNSSLLVTNVQSIENGLDDETDENFRYRIINQRMSQMAANETAIRLAALNVPGVADVTIYDQKMGLGTVSILIKSTTPVVSDTIIEMVQSEVDKVKGAGIKVIVDKPTELEMVFNIRINYKRTPTEEERYNAEIAVRNIVLDYINNLDIGAVYQVNELANLIISSDTNISSIGKTNKFIDNTYIYVPVGTQLIKKELIGNYVPMSTEKLVTGINYNSVNIIR